MAMENDQKKRTSWGNPSAFLWFFGCISVIGLAAAARWRELDIAFASAWLAFLVVGSSVVLWRAWKHPDGPSTAKLGQLAALPRSWQRWLLGEDKDGNTK
jgi:hypothetical protein